MYETVAFYKEKNEGIIRMQKIIRLIQCLRLGALAIVRTPSLERAAEIAKGCIDGGIPVMEMSYTLSNAGDIIEGLKQMYGGLIVCGCWYDTRFGDGSSCHT